MKKNRLVISIVTILILALVVGCATAENLAEKRTISVSGRGMVSVLPDTAVFTVTVSELGPTTTEAREETNKKVASVLAATDAFGIASDDVSTLSISFYPEYEWTDQGQKLRGQRAVQSISIKVRKIDIGIQVLSGLIDELGTIDNISVSSISFIKDDTTEAYVESRKLAVEKALQRAMDYAVASGMTLGKPLSITDSYDADVRSVSMNTLMKSAEAMAYDSRTPSQIPTGELEIVSNVSIVYEMY